MRRVTRATVNANKKADLRSEDDDASSAGEHNEQPYRDNTTYDAEQAVIDDLAAEGVVESSGVMIKMKVKETGVVHCKSFVQEYLVICANSEQQTSTSTGAYQERRAAGNNPSQYPAE